MYRMYCMYFPIRYLLPAITKRYETKRYETKCYKTKRYKTKRYETKR